MPIDWKSKVLSGEIVWNLGQLSRDQIKALDKLTRTGDVIKRQAMWPWVTIGMVKKTVWLLASHPAAIIIESVREAQEGRNPTEGG